MPRFLGLVVGALAAMLLAMPGGQALANHVQCGDVITQDTTLDSDLVDCPGDGIVIGADNITLDLKGHTIDGLVPTPLPPPHWGILDEGHSGVTIQDGTVREFYFGVRLSGASGNHLTGLQLVSMRRGEAINLLNSHDNVVNDNVAHGMCRGIYLIGSDRNVISGMTPSVTAWQSTSRWGRTGIWWRGTLCRKVISRPFAFLTAHATSSAEMS